MGSTTTKTVSGFSKGYQDQANTLLQDLQGLYDSGQLGQTAGFTEAQLQAQQAGMSAGQNQIGLEAQLAGMAGQTDLSGMRMGAQQQALQSLNLNAAGAGRTGGLGGSRQSINNQSIANDLAGKFGQIDLQQQQMDLTSTQAALNAQGTGAASMAAVGLGQQQQNQNVLDSSFKGISQLGEMFSALAGKQTTATETKGGK